jgi:hypothetical protein
MQLTAALMEQARNNKSCAEAEIRYRSWQRGNDPYRKPAHSCPHSHPMILFSINNNKAPSVLHVHLVKRHATGYEAGEYTVICPYITFRIIINLK